MEVDYGQRIVGAVYDRAFPGIDELRAVTHRAYNSSTKTSLSAHPPCEGDGQCCRADSDSASTTLTLNWLVLTFPVGILEIVSDCASRVSPIGSLPAVIDHV
jgi:hypothetical protein